MFKSENKASFRKYYSVSILIFSVFILFAGCEKKSEKPEGETVTKDTTSMNTSKQTGQDSTTMVDTTKQYPDLTGTWTGKFDQRPTTLYITEQNSENFKGHMTVPYKEPLNKQISGQFKSESKLSMKDEVHSRYMGTYNAKLSEDGKNISGTFTMNSNNSKIEFNFSKK